MYTFHMLYEAEEAKLKPTDKTKDSKAQNGLTFFAPKPSDAVPAVDW